MFQKQLDKQGKRVYNTEHVVKVTKITKRNWPNTDRKHTLFLISVEVLIMTQPQSTTTIRIATLVLRIVVVFAMVLALACMFSNSAAAKNIYMIKADAGTYKIETEAGKENDVMDEVTDVLTEAGVGISATDTVDIDVDTVQNESKSEVNNVVDVSVTRAEYAVVTVDGVLSSVLLQDGDTVQDVLSRLNIELGENDIVSMDLDAAVSGGDSVVINRVEISYFDETESWDYDTARVADPETSLGEEYIKQEGIRGSTTKTYEKKVIDGGEPIITLVNTETVEMQTEITAYGTRVYSPAPSSLSPSKNYLTNIDKENGTITLADGSTYGYRSIKDNFVATAYSGGGRTASGRSAQVGVIAVDTSVIPMGTRMFVTCGSVVYGVCVAGDTGSSIKGNRVDLYFDSSSQCYSFGRRDCTVYILD